MRSPACPSLSCMSSTIKSDRFFRCCSGHCSDRSIERLRSTGKLATGGFKRVGCTTIPLFWSTFGSTKDTGRIFCKSHELTLSFNWVLCSSFWSKNPACRSAFKKVYRLDIFFLQAKIEKKRVIKWNDVFYICNISILLLST